MPRDRWVLGPGQDVALALSWVPFAVAAHAMEAGGSLRALFAGVMFVSFVHQPLTFPLVYASPWRLASHKRLFLGFPAAAIAVIVIATNVSMTLVAVVGGLWNAEHILMQRYGLVRMYGRKAADGQGRVERWLLVACFAVPLLWVAGTGELRHVLDRLSSGSVDASAAGVLAGLSAEAWAGFFLATLAAICLGSIWAGREWRQGRAQGQANVGKLVYMGATLAMFAVALFDPVAAVVGFVASHSIEYFVLVGRSVGAESGQAGGLGRMIRLPYGRAAFFLIYAAVATVAFLALYRAASASVLLIAILAIGATHFFLDAFIWKLRKPAVRASLMERAPALTG